jgi:MFS family permease
MKFFATPTSVGVWQAFLALAAIYFVFMLCGAFGYRLPPPGWRPRQALPATSAASAGRYVPLEVAWRTRQFWLVWGVLCLNVTAGIGILGMASPLLQEVFGARLIGVSTSLGDLTQEQKDAITAIAAGFTGLLSLFNIAGRFFWASLSDYIGRKATYYTFFMLGIALYASVPWTAHSEHLGLFVAAFCIVLSMYGGGFATVPAYLADLFGTKMVGAIHGRLLTAWSTAGVLGPVLVNYIREYQIGHGVAKADAYSVTMYVLAGMLAVGLLCNWRVKAVEADRFVAGDDGPLRGATADSTTVVNPDRAHESSMLLVTAAWAAVLIPIGWGVSVTLQKAVLLFR